MGMTTAGDSPFSVVVMKGFGALCCEWGLEPFMRIASADVTELAAGGTSDCARTRRCVLFWSWLRASGCLDLDGVASYFSCIA